ncbi:Os02g0286933 [Oryza sativa Japonica Group]|uniref:Os02g0286933 protein n=2 Tax=Oryza sativa subsp. japonica TaxID=39947 RepID=C7IYK1_ORYSJ|nr:Os02g0286933 [Oryza sativa Japonica Group]|eukprot:NP_001172902.1 Os02g0286933 [Oryza sativa Japonica Group]
MLPNGCDATNSDVKVQENSASCHGCSMRWQEWQDLRGSPLSKGQVPPWLCSRVRPRQCVGKIHSNAMNTQVDVENVDVVIKPRMVPAHQGWQTSLCDCFGDGCESFCLSAWFPWLSISCIGEIVDQGFTEWCCICFIYLIAAYFGVWWAYAGWYRGKLRAQYGLPESPLPDCLTHLFCHWCALAQEHRELAARGYNVGTAGRRWLQYRLRRVVRPQSRLR